MKRVLGLFLIVAAVLQAGCAGPRQAPGSTQKFAPQPNASSPRTTVIIYLADALRADHLGVYGYTRATSPNIDAFAREAVTFETAYAQSSWTRPSVATLFTGLFASSHSVFIRNDTLSEDHLTMAEIFRAAGYRTAALATNFNVYPYFGFGQGFDDFFEYDNVEPDGRHYLPGDKLNRDVFAYLDTRPPAPLFLYVHAMDPHNPYGPPEPFYSQFSGSGPVTDPHGVGWNEAGPLRDLYDGEIAFTDHNFGQLLDKLKSLGLYEDSLIIFLSDHGEEFREHGGLFHGYSLYEEQVHVPLIVKLPRGAHAGRRVAAPVRLLDVLPTLCAMLGLEGGPHMDGASFLTLLQQGADPAWAPVLYAEEHHDGMVMRSLRTGNFKVVDTLEPDLYFEMYDLEADPGETRDIAGLRPGELAAMLAAMDRFAADLRSGWFLRFTNEETPGVRHRISGTISVSGGRFFDVSAGTLEKGDLLEVSGDAARISFAFELKNRVNPFPPPELMVDVERVRFRLDPPGAGITLDVRVDGKPLSADHMVLGDNGPLVDLPDGLVVLSGADPRLRIRPGPPPSLTYRPGDPLVRFYAVTRPARVQRHIDGPADSHLRSLGYLR